MGKEIEKKFKVKSFEYRQLSKPTYYHQGYISKNRKAVVRVRTINQGAYLTIKGERTGISRPEFEYQIPVIEAEEMLNTLCLQPTIKKYRYKVPYNGFIWEVDEFEGENEGLIIAEIELKYADQIFEKPGWVGEEVTEDPKYYNSNLIENPFKNWNS